MKFLAPLTLSLLASLATHSAGKTQGVQKTKTLADAIQEMHWNPDKAGPLLALEPAQIRTKGPSAGIAVFKRKSVAVGGLTAIMPWAAGQDLPTSSATNPRQPPSVQGSFTGLGISPDWPLPPTDMGLALLNYALGNAQKFQAQQGSLLIDASAFPIDRLGAMLDHWFQRVDENAG